MATASAWGPGCAVRPLAGADTRGGCDVHTSIADRGGHLSQRPEGVLNVDDQVDRHLPVRGQPTLGKALQVMEPAGLEPAPFVKRDALQLSYGPSGGSIVGVATATP